MDRYPVDGFGILQTDSPISDTSMKKHCYTWIALSTALATFSLTALAQADAPSVSTASIAKFEADFSSALQRNDAITIDRFVSDDWRIISGDGRVITKKRFLAVVSGGELTHSAMSTLGAATIRIYGDTALATVRTQSGGAYKGIAFHTDEISTDVIVKIHGRWVCVLTQLTTVSPEP
jgi:ketosteroid isomerase-like protein